MGVYLSRLRVAEVAALAIGAATVPALGVACGGASVLRGSGIPASQARALPPFRSVELAGSNILAIRVGGSYSVVVHADSNLLGHVTTKVRAGRLVISDKPGSFMSKSPMSVEVRMPSLGALRLTGSGDITAAGINTALMAITLAGSGNISASGKAAGLDVALAGSGNAQLAALRSRDVHAVLAGSGTIQVQATNSLRASIPGSGMIFYLGHPAHVTKSVTGSGTILQSPGTSGT